MAIIIQDLSNALGCQEDVAWGCVSLRVLWRFIEVAALRFAEETAQSIK